MKVKTKLLSLLVMGAQCPVLAVTPANTLIVVQEDA